MQTLDLVQRMDDWSNSLSPFNVPVELDSSERTLAFSEIEKHGIILSIHYYRTMLVASGPILLTVVQEAAQDRPPPSILRDVTREILKRDLAAATELQDLISRLLHGNRPFFKRNAIWWTCNYAGT